MEGFKEIFLAFIQALERNRVGYCILRGFEGLPETFSNDIDFGVHPNDRKMFIKSLIDYKNTINVRIYLRDSRYEVLKMTFLFQRSSIDFDFWFGINYVGLRYMDIRSMLTGYTLYNNIRTLSAENEVTLSFLKELLHNNRIRSDKINILNNRIQKSDLNKCATFFKPKMKYLFKSAIINKEFRLKHLSKKTKKEIIKFNVANYGLLKTMENVFLFGLFRYFPKLNPLVRNVSPHLN